MIGRKASRNKNNKTERIAPAVGRWGWDAKGSDALVEAGRQFSFIIILFLTSGKGSVIKMTDETREQHLDANGLIDAIVGFKESAKNHGSATWRICETLGLLFIALKCAGSLQWDWFYVTMPIWGWVWLQILLSLSYRAFGLKEMVEKEEESRLIQKVTDGNRVLADAMRMALEEMCEDIAVVQMEADKEQEQGGESDNGNNE